jgi:hypothetical protein
MLLIAALLLGRRQLIISNLLLGQRVVIVDSTIPAALVVLVKAGKAPWLCPRRYRTLIHVILVLTVSLYCVVLRFGGLLLLRFCGFYRFLRNLGGTLVKGFYLLL